MAYKEYFKTCKGDETVKNLIEDINNWLKVRWTAANYCNEFPSLEKTRNMVNSWFECFMKSLKPSDFKDYYADDFSDYNLWTRLFPKIVIKPSEISYTEAVIALKALDNASVFYELGVITFSEEIEGKCYCVCAVCIDGREKTEIKSLLYEIAYIQNNWSRTDIVNAYLSVPESFRWDHPMCPRCGDVVWSGVDEDKNGKHIIHCSPCGWDSNKHYYNLHNFLEVDNYKKEFNLVEKMESTEEALNKAFEEFDRMLGKLAIASTEYRKVRKMENSDNDKRYADLIYTIKEIQHPTKF